MAPTVLNYSILHIKLLVDFDGSGNNTFYRKPDLDHHAGRRAPENISLPNPKYEDFLK